MYYQVPADVQEIFYNIIEKAKSSKAKADKKAVGRAKTNALISGETSADGASMRQLSLRECSERSQNEQVGIT